MASFLFLWLLALNVRQGHVSSWSAPPLPLSCEQVSSSQDIQCTHNICRGPGGRRFAFFGGTAFGLKRNKRMKEGNPRREPTWLFSLLQMPDWGASWLHSTICPHLMYVLRNNSVSSKCISPSISYFKMWMLTDSRHE